jgi:hypothetical protein
MAKIAKSGAGARRNKINLMKVIAAIEDVVGDDFCEELSIDLGFDSITEVRLKEAAEKLGEVYRLSHAFNTAHSCYSAHKSWRKIRRKAQGESK